MMAIFPNVVSLCSARGKEEVDERAWNTKTIRSFIRRKNCYKSLTTSVDVCKSAHVIIFFADVYSKLKEAYGSIFGGASFVQVILTEQKPRYTNQNDTFLHFLLIVQVQKVSWFKFRNQQWSFSFEPSSFSSLAVLRCFSQQSNVTSYSSLVGCINVNVPDQQSQQSKEKHTTIKHVHYPWLLTAVKGCIYNLLHCCETRKLTLFFRETLTTKFSWEIRWIRAQYFWGVNDLFVSIH